MRALLIALLTIAAAPVSAGARQEATVLMPENPQMLKVTEDWGFAEAVVAGDTVYLSGAVAGLAPGETDLKIAYKRTFDYIDKILARAGASWDDVVEMTTYHTDLTTQMPAIVEVKKNYVKAPYPAWTAIEVARLIPDRGITEIKVVAKLPKKR